MDNPAVSRGPLEHHSACELDHTDIHTLIGYINTYLIAVTSYDELELCNAPGDAGTDCSTRVSEKRGWGGSVTAAGLKPC